MGCVTSTETDTGPRKARRTKRRSKGEKVTEDSDSEDERRHAAMRRTPRHNSFNRYTTPNSEHSGSEHSIPKDRRSSIRGSSVRSAARDTLLNSDVGASNLIMSQRASSTRSFGSPHLLAPPVTPKGAGSRPPLPAPSRAIDRRVSVGRFADEPSFAEIKARQDSVAAKAKVQHGIDATVEEVTEKIRKQNARMGFSALGMSGINRIKVWAAAVASAMAAEPAITPDASPTLRRVDSCSSPTQALIGSPRNAALPGAVMLEEDLPPPVVTTGDSASPRASQRTKAHDIDDDVDNLIFFSGKNSPTRTGGSVQRLSEETLRALQNELHGSRTRS